MFWAFLGGAADSLNKQLQSELQSEQELAAYERKLEIAQKSQEKAEAAKRALEVIYEGVNPETGTADTVRRDGTVESVPLPQPIVSRLRSQEKAARDKEAAKEDRAERRVSAEETRAGNAAQRGPDGLTPYERARVRQGDERNKDKGNKPPTASQLLEADKTANETIAQINEKAAEAAQARFPDDAEAGQVFMEKLDKALQEAAQIKDPVSRAQTLNSILMQLSI